MRINCRWRICFNWVDGDAHDVELSDHYKLFVTNSRGAQRNMESYAKIPHPGSTLKDILENCGTSQTVLAQAINVEPKQIADLVDGKVMMTQETDSLLTNHFGMSDGFFMRLHHHWCRLNSVRLHQVLSGVSPIPESFPGESEATSIFFRYRLTPVGTEVKREPKSITEPDSGYENPERQDMEVKALDQQREHA